MLWQDLKQEDNKYSQYFYAIYLVVKFVVCIFYVACYDYPEVQAMGVFSLHFLMFGYLLWTRPFVQKFNNFTMVVSEILLSLLHVLIFVIIKNSDD